MIRFACSHCEKVLDADDDLTPVHCAACGHDTVPRESEILEDEEIDFKETVTAFSEGATKADQKKPKKKKKKKLQRAAEKGASKWAWLFFPLATVRGINITALRILVTAFLIPVLIWIGITVFAWVYCPYYYTQTKMNTGWVVEIYEKKGADIEQVWNDKLPVRIGQTPDGADPEITWDSKGITSLRYRGWIVRRGP